MRGVPKLLLASAIAALLAIGLGACGSSGSDDSTAATSGQTTAPSTTGDQGADEAEKEQSGSGEDSDDASSESSPSTAKGSAAFLTPGGDNSIQNFGEEADSEQLESATTTLDGYLQARSEGDWAGSCVHLAKTTVAPLERFAAASPQLKGKGCAAILAALQGRTPASTRTNTMTVGLASLRIEDDHGFALYHGPDGVDYFMSMVKEDGEWKVGALAPSEFP